MSPDQPIDLSIVVPLYNEEESLAPLCGQIEAALAGAGLSFEVVFVDDGSTDRSFEVLGRLAATYGWLRAVRFRRNYRKAAALAAGFKESRGRLVATLDADMQDDPAEIANLLAALEEGEGKDLVSGWKRRRRDPITKTLPSRLFNLITSAVSGIRLHDFNCGIKLYRREVIEEAMPFLYGELYRFLPAIAHWAGYRVGELPVTHHPRRFGRSKFGTRRLLNGLLDLLSITFVVRFLSTPMHVFGTLGLLCTLTGGGIGAYITHLWWETGTIQHRQPLMMLSVLLIIVGIQFFSTGLLGDMLASLHQRGGRTPSIRDRLGPPGDPGSGA